MIKLRDILTESGLTGVMQIKGLGQVTCKWDTGATTRASALHATDIRVDGDAVTWSFKGRTHKAPLAGYSDPKHKAQRPIVQLSCTWQGRSITAPFALTDRSTMSTDLLCNLSLMQQLGVELDINSGAQ